jgi:hypothetical protein
MTMLSLTERQKNPNQKGRLAHAAWVMARLGGWTGYYGKPGPVVMLRGMLRFAYIKDGGMLGRVGSPHDLSKIAR